MNREHDAGREYAEIWGETVRRTGSSGRWR